MTPKIVKKKLFSCIFHNILCFARVIRVENTRLKTVWEFGATIFWVDPCIKYCEKQYFIVKWA